MEAIDLDRKLEVSAVLFDLDGTLINTVPLIMDSHRHTFQKFLGWVPDDRDILATIGEPLVTTFSRYGQLGDRMMAEYIDWSVPKTGTHCSLFNGLVPMLEALKAKGFLTGVVTARRCQGLAVCLESFQLEDYFDVLVCAEDTERHKPDPAPILLAMERLAIRRPDRVLYVGDTVHDLASAAGAGALFAAVAWTAMDKEVIDRAGPDFWLEDLADLPDRLTFADPD